MKMKSFAMLAMSGLAASLFYIAPAMADDSIAGSMNLADNSMQNPTDNSMQNPSDSNMQNQNNDMSSMNMNNQSHENMHNPANPTGNNDAGMPDTATGDDDY